MDAIDRGEFAGIHEVNDEEIVVADRATRRNRCPTSYASEVA